MDNPHLSTFERTIIVDGFYKNPDMIRQYALANSKTEQSDGNYAGVMTRDNFLTQDHLDIVGELVGHRVIPSTGFTGKFRFTKLGDPYKQDIHFDPGDNNCAWAGVLYLTPDISGIDGTMFWKHRRTGLESIPRTLEGINQYGWKDTGDLATFLNTEGIDHSLWDRTLTIPYKFNRLILFRPWMFHSPGPAFGDKLDNARLIQTFFWSPA